MESRRQTAWRATQRLARRSHESLSFDVGVFICLAIAVLGGWAWKVRADTRAGLGEPPTKGELLSMGPHEIAAMDHVWGNSRGFVVWSSTMYGEHDLVRFDWPSGKLTRLTSSPFTDSTPKISPTGKQVVFARSRQEWVSFRNLEEWDIWVLDLQTHKEKLVAERGAEPCWTRRWQVRCFPPGRQTGGAGGSGHRQGNHPAG